MWVIVGGVPEITLKLEQLIERTINREFRGLDVVELQNFRPATTYDITSVHAGPYISGLEKVALAIRFLFNVIVLV
ncbi:hypothetical protein RND71_014506 [Anisodus tanguticus]|uniref:Uncharacterized protein n=1 Tax=Anisodus tanguticus TaxID=243964 RepID=A0AAE1VJZ1_9SOLA|nr:hypothetical protein RND71_014506 [Anisodus tanguticus]